MFVTAFRMVEPNKRQRLPYWGRTAQQVRNQLKEAGHEEDESIQLDFAPFIVAKAIRHTLWLDLLEAHKLTKEEAKAVRAEYQLLLQLTANPSPRAGITEVKSEGGNTL